MDPEAAGMQSQAARLTWDMTLDMLLPNDRGKFPKLLLDFLEDARPSVEMLRADPNVQTLSKNKYLLNGATSLHLAVLMEDTTMVTEILAADVVDVNVDDGSISKRTALHYAVESGNVGILNLMLTGPLESGKLDVNVQCRSERTAFHDAVKRGNMDIVKLMVNKHLKLGKFDVNVVDITGFTALHSAIEHGDRENVLMVKELLRCKDMRLSEECKRGRTPLQISHAKGYRVIQRVLMEKEVVRRYVEDLYKDRRVYVDAANAILVGATLIASVTFYSWLQPPLGLTSDYVDVQHNIGLRVFWIFNSFSFYFAIATVVFGARSVLPRNMYFIKRTVEKLRKNLLVTAALLVCSVFFVIIAFGTVGCIVLMPILKYRWYMIVPTIIGGLVCLISLEFLYCSI